MSGGATTAYRQLLKAIKKHIGNEEYKRHFTDFVTREFRNSHNLSDHSSIQQSLTLANNYTYLLNSVHHQKGLLFSYNIAVDRSEEMRRVLGKSAASVGLRLPEAEFWICLLLTILGYIPGIIYAIYVLVG